MYVWPGFNTGVLAIFKISSSNITNEKKCMSNASVNIEIVPKINIKVRIITISYKGNNDDFLQVPLACTHILIQSLWHLHPTGYPSNTWVEIEEQCTVLGIEPRTFAFPVIDETTQLQHFY